MQNHNSENKVWEKHSFKNVGFTDKGKGKSWIVTFTAERLMAQTPLLTRMFSWRWGFLSSQNSQNFQFILYNIMKLQYNLLYRLYCSQRIITINIGPQMLHTNFVWMGWKNEQRKCCENGRHYAELIHHDPKNPEEKKISLWLMVQKL